MKGLELARRFWEEALCPAIEERAPELMDRLAAGLIGAGSDCLGFDDEVSRDHSFAAGCMVFLSEIEDRQTVFRLSSIYDTLPRVFLGFPAEHRSRQGDGRYGVKTLEGFFRPLTGSDGAPADAQAWLSIPSSYLAEALAGEIFHDGPGELTRRREEIRTGMPEDVWLKKLAAGAALMAQSGQYNFSRCLRHGEEAAARLAADEFVRRTLQVVFLLNRRPAPFYKWVFRAMDSLERLSELKIPLEEILRTPSAERIEQVSAAVIDELRREGLSAGSWDYLEPHAYEIMRRIRDPEIAALHIMEG